MDKSGKITDDAGYVKLSGINLHFVKGEKYNIKITEPEDLILAEYYFNKFNF